MMRCSLCGAIGGDRLIGWIVLAPSRGNLQLNWEVQ